MEEFAEWEQGFRFDFNRNPWWQQKKQGYELRRKELQVSLFRSLSWLQLRMGMASIQRSPNLCRAMNARPSEACHGYHVRSRIFSRMYECAILCR